jgi:hypothetical protein
LHAQGDARKRIFLCCVNQEVYGGRDLKKMFAVIISKDFASIPTSIITEVSFSSLNGLASQGDR